MGTVLTIVQVLHKIINFEIRSIHKIQRFETHIYIFTVASIIKILESELKFIVQPVTLNITSTIITQCYCFHQVVFPIIIRLILL